LIRLEKKQKTEYKALQNEERQRVEDAMQAAKQLAQEKAEKGA